MGLVSKTIRDYADEAIADWRANIDKAAIDELVWLRELGDDVRRMAAAELERRGGAKAVKP